jgi:hypothetical protein
MKKKLMQDKQIKKKISYISLDPQYITGLFDGEGSLGLSISKNSKRSLGYVITLSFEIGLHSKDLDLLKGLQAYFGVGGIYKHTGDMMRYKVSSIRDITKVIIPHFELYPLVTQKRADFEILKCVIEIINKGPVSQVDLQKIVNLKASLNNGLSSELQASFPKTVPVQRSILPFTAPLHPLWVVGFTEAESSFFIGFYKSSSCKLGRAARLRFVLTQHSRDDKLLQGFIEFFGCGSYTLRKNKLAGDFIVFKLEDLNSKIIPFFLKYPLRGSKSLSFNDFCLGAKIMNEKGHLTPEGLNSLEIIKSRMNKF